MKPRSELDDLQKAILEAAMPQEVEKVALDELTRLSKADTSSAEYTIGVNYLGYLKGLPWHSETVDNLDMRRAATILDDEHHGLDDVKERILEHLAVKILKLSRKPAILVVDDDKTARRNLAHVLGKEGYEVQLAAGGAEALALLSAKTFDVLVTDLKMDKVDGLQVVEKAVAVSPDIGVIMVTGYATPPAAVEAITRGAFHFLAKPLQLDLLRKTIKDLLLKKTANLGSRGPLLCFVGPPGTGKTSLQRSIAKSLGRKFIRISLAGVKDEAEIRGHRRSYVGALPGRIIQEINRAGSKNPVIMLDEIDKLDHEGRGNTAAALLEVLDHSQNHHFLDHYLDVPFDLSWVIFIATANSTANIPAPLLDRLEILSLPGYTEEEKEVIAVKHLVPREVDEAGLAGHPLEFTKEAIEKIIRDHTREAGLRNLQRQIAAICRKIARKVLADQNGVGGDYMVITPEKVDELLGPRKFYFDLAAVREQVGVVTGLAWTESGGQIMFLEATIMKGKENLLLTGSLGEVMKESAQAALSYIRSNAARFQVADDFFLGHDIHIHLPAGAIPKDGPSAGLAIALALLSLLTNRAARKDVALSGELTLSGRLLPVGGVREKVMAARRAGIKKVIFPSLNEPDLLELPPEIKRDLQIFCAATVEEIVEHVLR
ncbi:MAG: endopeptidase La [Desulfobulbaceae bacterium]|nr:endopeptidase La [Desulfobulbaceae bacterium]